MGNLSWRVLAVFGVLIAAIIYVLPTIEPSFWPHKKINLGLDLQGGMHLALEVDTDKAVEGTIERIMQEIRSFLKPVAEVAERESCQIVTELIFKTTA